MLVEIVMHGVCNGVTDACHGTEGVGTRSQMGNTTQKFVGVLFFADWIGLGVVD